MTKRLSTGGDFPSLFGSKSQQASLNSFLAGQENTDSHLIHHVNINSIVCSPYQPRRVFESSALNELTDSIRLKGVLQPIWVRKASKEGAYEIIAGERRWRAAKQAELTEIPVLIHDVDDKTAMAMALIENIQRCDLAPIDEAIAFQRLLEQHQINHQELAVLVSKSRTTITNILRLLKLDNQVQKLLNDRLIEVGHAKVLLGVEVEKQYEIASLIVQKGLSVRELEMLVKNKIEKYSVVEATIDSMYQTKIKRLTDLLSEKLSFPFKFKATSKGQGAVLTVKFKNVSQAGQFVENFKIEV
jgi:ParB family chromosome partitioning protein